MIRKGFSLVRSFAFESMLDTEEKVNIFVDIAKQFSGRIIVEQYLYRVNGKSVNAILYGIDTKMPVKILIMGSKAEFTRFHNACKEKHLCK